MEHGKRQWMDRYYPTILVHWTNQLVSCKITQIGENMDNDCPLFQIQFDDKCNYLLSLLIAQIKPLLNIENGLTVKHKKLHEAY